MKRTLRGLLAVVLLLTPGNGTFVIAAGRTKKLPPAETVAEPLVAPIMSAELRSIGTEPNRIRITLSQLVNYKIYAVQNPTRLVVELANVVNKAAPEKTVKGDLYDRVHIVQAGEGPTVVSRVVLDILQPIDYEAHPVGSDILLTLRPSAAAGKLHGTGDLLDNLPREKINLDLEGDDIREALALLSQMSKINIIYGADIQGSITIHLTGVPFDQAFRTVLSMGNLVAQQLGDNIIMVMTPAIFNQSKISAPLGTRTIPLNYANIGLVKTNLDTVRAAAGRRGVTVADLRTNSITVMDTAEGLDEAERLVDALDKKPIQVLIEARLVEVDLDDLLDLGIQWGAAYGSQSNGTNYGIGTTQLNSTAANSLGTNNPTSGIVNGTAGGFVTPLSPATTTSPATGVNLPAASTAGAFSFGFVNSTTSLIASLNAMASKNKARVLSAPKIATLNSEEAKIEADEQIPYPVTTVTGTGVSQQSFQFVSAGIILTVTPTANAEDQIMLKLNPVVSFPIAGLTSVGPTIQTRSAQTTVLVNDGQTLVVGGLINQTDTDNIQKVPFFGDIPILGAFFRHSLKEKNRTELLVFVTPHIIKD